jgi:predicted negative regulator of RcsB-dependent stress response
MSDDAIPPSDSPRLEEAGQDWFTANLKWVGLATVILLAAGLTIAWWLSQQESLQAASLESAYAAATANEWEKVIQDYPQSAGALVSAFRAAEEAKRENRYEEAAGYYAQVLKIAPDSPFSRMAEFAQAGCLEAAGLIDQALPLYENIHSQRPDHPYLGGAVIGLARIEAKQGNTLAARELLADYLASHSQVPGQPLDPFVPGCQELMAQLPKPELASPTPEPAVQEDNSAR